MKVRSIRTSDVRRLRSFVPYEEFPHQCEHQPKQTGNFSRCFFFYLFIWLFIYFFHFFIWNVFHFRRWFCRTIQYRAWLIFICHPFLNGFGALKPKFSVLNQFHRRKDVRNLPCNAHCIKYRFKIALYTTRRLCVWVCVWVCVCVRLVSMRIVCTDFGPNGR